MGDEVGDGNPFEIVSVPREQLLEKVGLKKRLGIFPPSQKRVGETALELLESGGSQNQVDARALVLGRDIRLGEIAAMDFRPDQRTPQEQLEQLRALRDNRA